MRILFILLAVSLCLVTAKYLPHDGSDSNLVHRVRRSDSQDSDSNTASVERDDDSSNDNDRNDGEEDNSAERAIEEERNKVREKEEKKKQKLLEKIEKEKQKEIKEKIKLEEKLAKQLRKEQEKQEKEERKLQEKLEKEKQKLEKQEKKRQEKLNKKLEKLQKEQIESAEDTYLETEEEDSVEMEDIWKVHVYDKYGINITSTKLERQAALQRYLQEELGIDANSTKSERRQAILKLIQTKLQNDSVAVESFRNLLLSHVNAAQIQKLKSKLENDLEELNNKTELLKNISLPWAFAAQQNMEEKRTFLQAIAQFLSNIVPNWLMGAESSNNVTQINESGIIVNTDTSGNSENSNGPSSNGQPAQSVPFNDNGSISNDAVGGESNLSVLPSNIANSSSLNNPSEHSGSLGTGSPNSDISVSQNNGNGLLSSTGTVVNSDSSNASTASNNGLPPHTPSQPASVGSVSLDNNVSTVQSNLSGQPEVTDDSANTNVAITQVSNNSGSLSSNSVDLNQSLDGNATNDNVPVSSIGANGLSSSTANTVNSDFPDTSALTDVNALNPLTSADSGVGSSNPLVLHGSESNDSVNVLVSPPSVNGSSSSAVPAVDSVLTNTPVSNEFNSNAGNSLGPDEVTGSSVLENITAVNSMEINRNLSNVENSPNNLSNSTTVVETGLSSSNPSQINDSVSSDSVLNDDPGSQTNVNVLSPSNPNSIIVEPSDLAAATSESSLNNLSETTVTESGNIDVTQNNVSEVSSNLSNIDATVLTNEDSLLISEPLTSNSSRPNISGISSDMIQDNASLSNVSNKGSEVTTDQLDLVGENSTAATSVNLKLPNDVSTIIVSNTAINNIANDQSEVTVIPAEPTAILTSELVNSTSKVNSSLVSEQPSGNTSTITSSGANDSISNDVAVSSSISDGVQVEIKKVNENKALISENIQNVPTEGVIGSITTEENATTDENSFNGLTTVSGIPVVTNDSLSSGLNNSTLSVTIADEPPTTNSETVTDVTSANIPKVHAEPYSLDGGVSNVDVTTGILDAETLSTSVVPMNDVTQLEAQTEQGNLLAQEIVNTPSDSVTVASFQDPSSPPLSVIVPVEPDASVIDIKLQ